MPVPGVSEPESRKVSPGPGPLTGPAPGEQVKGKLFYHDNYLQLFGIWNLGSCHIASYIAPYTYDTLPGAI